MMLDEKTVQKGTSVSIERDLRDLRAMQAPSSVLPTVLTRVGLADSYFPLETPIGLTFVAYNRHGISAVMQQTDAAAFEEAFRARIHRAAHPAPEPPAALREAVTAQLTGERRRLRFDLRGLSEFEEAVLRKAVEIPRGEVRPYAWVAREIGRPRAVRAVGTALAHNPIPLLIPCHRVVRSDGSLGQYGLGAANKRVMLAAEGMTPAELDEQTPARARYIGSDSTKIYCFPSCRHARRIGPTHRHAFRTDQEAENAGYRPCHVCRPAERVASA